MENRNYEAKPDACAPATRSELRYEQAGSDRPAHHGTIPLTAAIPGQASPIGVGGNTKEGKRMGAKKALKGLKDKENPGPVMKIATESPTAQVQKKSWLNESIQKDRVPRSVLASVNVNPIVVAEKQHPAHFGKTQREAKEDAAGPNVTCDSKATELSSCSGVPDDCRPATPPCTLESIDAQSKSVETATSESVPISSDSLEDQSVVMKPKSRSSSNVHSTSDEDGNVSTGNSPSEMTTTQSETMWFTSHFDSIVGLGKGGFGRVFKAKEILSGKCFAIKIVLCKEKALREVKALSKLNHPNIVRYQTCWLADSGYQWDSAADSYSSSQSSTDSSTMKFLYIQMELCDTKTLRLWIDEKNTNNVKKSLQDSKRREEGLGIAEQIACGLEYIHSNNFIHRDLKPENILFGEQGKIKIGDFGLATADKDDDAENLVERTVKKGTPSYMAPEQESQKTYDRKVDVFALGLICFELLWTFSTAHEKQEVWKNLRRQMFPEEFPYMFSKEYMIIRQMLSERTQDRPEASQIKKHLEECCRRLNAPHSSRSV